MYVPYDPRGSCDTILECHVDTMIECGVGPGQNESKAVVGDLQKNMPPECIHAAYCLRTGEELYSASSGGNAPEQEVSPSLSEPPQGTERSPSSSESPPEDPYLVTLLEFIKPARPNVFRMCNRTIPWHEILQHTFCLPCFPSEHIPLSWHS